MSSPSAFCDEDVIHQRQEGLEQESRQEMYSEQRKEMMSKQVSSLHQSKQEQVTTSSSMSADPLRLPLRALSSASRMSSR